MDTYRCVTTRRTIRRFKPKAIPSDLMDRVLNAGRLAPSAANRQILEFLVVQESVNREKLFEQLAWAGYVRPKRNPPEGKRPMAYVIVLIRGDRIGVNEASDGAAAIENMILTAWSEGVGSCWIGSVQHDRVKTRFGVGNEYQVYGVLALGYPDEQPQVEVLTDSHQYWLDENDVLHVPKRRLSDIMHYETFGHGT